MHAVNFIEGENRKVELLYGEAYFDVSPSTLHKGSKFIVSNQSQEIEVLGTEFNIKAYKDESNLLTTLVEGKVAIHAMNNTLFLNPNQQFKLDVINNSTVISEVDVYREISWKMASTISPEANLNSIISSSKPYGYCETTRSKISAVSFL